MPSAPPAQSSAAESASATAAPSSAATPPPAPPAEHARNTVSVTSTFTPAPEAKSPPPVARVAFLISSARIRTACGGFATSPPAFGAEPHSIEANGAGTAGSRSVPFGLDRTRTRGRDPTSPETRTGIAAPSSTPQFPALACSPGRNTTSAGAASVNVAPEATAAASATVRSAQGAQCAPHALASALTASEASGAMNTRAALSRAPSAEAPWLAVSRNGPSGALRAPSPATAVRETNAVTGAEGVCGTSREYWASIESIEASRGTSTVRVVMLCAHAASEGG